MSRLSKLVLSWLHLAEGVTLVQRNGFGGWREQYIEAMWHGAVIGRAIIDVRMSETLSPTPKKGLESIKAQLADDYLDAAIMSDVWLDKTYRNWKIGKMLYEKAVEVTAEYHCLLAPGKFQEGNDTSVEAERVWQSLAGKYQFINGFLVPPQLHLPNLHLVAKKANTLDPIPSPLTDPNVTTVQYLNDVFTEGTPEEINLAKQQLASNQLPDVKKIPLPNAVLYLSGGFVIDPENEEIEKPRDYVNGLNDWTVEEMMIGPNDVEPDFWEENVDPRYNLFAYHATDPDNVKSIQETGLGMMSRTRGINNRSVGAAVFASFEIERIDSYGSAVFAINLSAMARDGYKPNVSYEPGYNAHDPERLKERLAHMLGYDDYYADVESGLDPETIIIHGAVPAKYLELVAGGEED